jgi:DNA-directed RNA polymerase specialized sigma24 family protein
MLSLNFETENENGDICSPLDSLPDTAPLMSEIISDRLLLEQLIQRLQELDPNADRILQMLAEDKSDRSIAVELGRPQRTFARQMQRYRGELRKIRGY